MTTDFTIVVMSTDSYEDTWTPFFRLFDAYWPDCGHPIVLNTETKSFDYPKLDIRCSRVGQPGGRHPTWGQCMHKILSDVQTDLLLYLDCDYFINDRVDAAQIGDFAEFMSAESWSKQVPCGCVHLTHFGPQGPFHLSEHPLLWEVDPQSRYRISFQAALWDVSFLRSLVRLSDNAWALEERHSARKSRSAKRVLTVNRHEFRPGGRAIVPYVHTGIIRGKWNREAVCGLFDQHGIVVDYSTRGFSDEASARRTGVSDMFAGVRRRLRRLLNERIDQFRYP